MLERDVSASKIRPRLGALGEIFLAFLSLSEFISLVKFAWLVEGGGGEGELALLDGVGGNSKRDLTLFARAVKRRTK